MLGRTTVSTEYTENQLRYRRSLGVSRAWDRERELVKQGRGTREWTTKQQKELLKTGRVKGFQGHHMKSVKKYPEYADNPKNIQFLDTSKNNNEHLKAHKGNYQNESNGRYNVNSGKIREMKDGKPRAMNSYELKNKAIEQKGYKKYAKENAKPSNSNSSKVKAGKSDKVSYNGKSYERSLVKQGNAKSSGKSASAAKSSAAKQASGGRYGARTGSVGGKSAKSGNYGAKTSARSSARSSGSTGGYGKGGRSASASSGGRSASTGGGRSASSGGQSGGKGSSSGGQSR